MGTQVTVTVDDQLKPNYTVATVAAGSFTITNGQLALFVGTDFNGGKHQEVSAVKRCGEVIRENGNKTPVNTNQSYAAVIQPALKSQVESNFDVIAVLPTEAHIGIWYGSAFQAIAGASIAPAIKRALEKYLETTQKKN